MTTKGFIADHFGDSFHFCAICFIFILSVFSESEPFRSKNVNGLAGQKSQIDFTALKNKFKCHHYGIILLIYLITRIKTFAGNRGIMRAKNIPFFFFLKLGKIFCPPNS